MNILYEDKDVLVCVKEANVPTQSRSVRSQDMVSMVKSYLAGKNHAGEPYLGLIHRLDQPVEGILVFARNPRAAGDLSRQLREGLMEKRYLAVMTGSPPRQEGRLVDYLVSDPRNNLSAIVPQGTPGAKRAELFYRILKSRENLYLGEIRLVTGRHHQIRAQMANAQAPLWGDTKYNESFKHRKGWFTLALCANHLAFRHPSDGRDMDFEIEPSGEIFW